jgi:hypothetical protein
LKYLPGYFSGQIIGESVKNIPEDIADSTNPDGAAMGYTVYCGFHFLFPPG